MEKYDSLIFDLDGTLWDASNTTAKFELHYSGSGQVGAEPEDSGSYSIEIKPTSLPTPETGG